MNFGTPQEMIDEERNYKEKIMETSTQNYFDTQKGVIHEYLRKNEATASMVAKATGIPHKNVCRYKDMLEREGKLTQVRRARCKISNHQAWYLTCEA